jgi:GNAT superfamily N-acetyltransferase
MANVRTATEADLAVVVETVSLAFVDDPAWDFMLGVGRLELARAFARYLFLPRAARGTAWVAEDGLAVAMWDRKLDGGDGPADDDWWDAFRDEAGPEVWARLEAYEQALVAVGPQPPYWYLGVLATHPEHQGRGLARAVLQPGLAAADAEGWDCWLETSKPRNKPFYAGHGFTEPVEADIVGGPPTWWLRRPRAGGR